MSDKPLAGAVRAASKVYTHSTSCMADQHFGACDFDCKEKVALVIQHTSGLLELLEAAKKIQIIIDNSRGVDGWHLNGDIATWDEFEEREEFDAAIENVRKP